jgi:hypothetical protein
MKHDTRFLEQLYQSVYTLLIHEVERIPGVDPLTIEVSGDIVSTSPGRLGAEFVAVVDGVERRGTVSVAVARDAQAKTISRKDGS